MPDEDPLATTPFPLCALPAWQRSMVEAVAAATKTDPSIAAMMSIAVVSSTVARKVVVRTDSELTPPLTLWVLVAMGTGQGKSPVFGSLVSPLTLVQRALDRPAGATTLPIASNLRRKTNWERLRENPYAEAAPEVTGVEMEVAVRAMREHQERAHPGVGVDFLTDDITPAALVEAAGSQVAAIAWLAPEGGFDAWIGGGARGTNNMGTLCKAWDGEDIRKRRVDSRPGAERPCLAMGVMAQPDAVLPVLRNPILRSRGYAKLFAQGVEGQLFAPLDNYWRDLHDACVAAGVTSVSSQDLRRSAGQWMVDIGVPLEIVSKFMRHKDITTTQRWYAEIRDADVAGRLLDSIDPRLARAAHKARKKRKGIETIKRVPQPKGGYALYAVDGVEKTLDAWAGASGIPKTTLHYRVVTAGMTMPDALALGPAKYTKRRAAPQTDCDAGVTVSADSAPVIGPIPVPAADPIVKKPLKSRETKCARTDSNGRLSASKGGKAAIQHFAG